MRILIVLLLATSAFAADRCQSAKKDLETFLDTLPRNCTQDFDCTGRYLRVDSCAPPVVVSRDAKVTDMQAFLKLQKAVRSACAAEFASSPACSPIPYKEKCVQNKCRDTIREDIAALPKGPYSHGTINHSCGPADGPALAITLTQGKDSKAPWIYLSINENLLELPITSPKTYDLDLRSQALAGRCVNAGDCAAATSGSFTIEHLERSGGTGHYKLHFRDDTTKEGDFKLEWIEVRMLCG
jgi:hypothetical protein